MLHVSAQNPTHNPVRVWKIIPATRSSTYPFPLQKSSHTFLLKHGVIYTLYATLTHITQFHQRPSPSRDRTGKQWIHQKSQISKVMARHSPFLTSMDTLLNQLHSIVFQNFTGIHARVTKRCVPVIVLVSLRCKYPRPRGSVNTAFCDTRKNLTLLEMHQHLHRVPNSLDY